MIHIDVKKKLDGANGVLPLHIQLNIEEGQFVTLYGPSGAGKTSTLRMLAGLMQPDTGKINVDGNQWYDSVSKTCVKPQERGVGYVFQDYALFPNMTVLGNLEYAANDPSQKAYISELLDIVDLQSLKNSYPKKLSGGQQQRVALARALVQQPRILLMDEPLAALDMETRLKLQTYISKIHKEMGLTVIMVSHDLDEISRLSEVVYRIENGNAQRHHLPLHNKSDKSIEIQATITDISQENDKWFLTTTSPCGTLKISIKEKDKDRYNVGEVITFRSVDFHL